jgi:glutaredoxin-related protein
VARRLCNDVASTAYLTWRKINYNYVLLTEEGLELCRGLYPRPEMPLTDEPHAKTSVTITGALAKILTACLPNTAETAPFHLTDLAHYINMPIITVYH